VFRLFALLGLLSASVGRCPQWVIAIFTGKLLGALSDGHELQVSGRVLFGW